MRRAVAAAPPPAANAHQRSWCPRGCGLSTFRTPSRSARVATRRAAALLGTLAERNARALGRAASASLPSTSPPRCATGNADRRDRPAVLWRDARGAGGERARAIVGDEQAPARTSTSARSSLLYYDSYCAAVWTSAHAEYLGCIQDLLGERAATEALVRESHGAPARAVHRGQHEPPGAPWGALRAHASPRCCSKSSQALLAILTRVTNAGSRGWETTLLAALKESDGAVRVCMQCLAVALTGSTRRSTRRCAGRGASASRCSARLRVQTQQDFKEIVQRRPRDQGGRSGLHLAARSCRLRDARRHAARAAPHGQLCVPPMGMPAGRSRPRCTAWRTRARP